MRSSKLYIAGSSILQSGVDRVPYPNADCDILCPLAEYGNVMFFLIDHGYRRAGPLNANYNDSTHDEYGLPFDPAGVFCYEEYIIPKYALHALRRFRGEFVVDGEPVTHWVDVIICRDIRVHVYRFDINLLSTTYLYVGDDGLPTINRVNSWNRYRCFFCLLWFFVVYIIYI
jgi:hypothetical protein